MLNADWLFGIVIHLRVSAAAMQGRVLPKATTAQERQKTSILAAAGAVAAPVPSCRFR